MLNLRKLDLRKHSLRAAMHDWQENVDNLLLGFPQTADKWVQVSDKDSKWCGWLSLTELRSSISEQFVGIALTPQLEKLLLQWLSSTKRPFSMPIPALDCETIIVGSIVEGFPQTESPLLRVTAGNLTIWLAEVRQDLIPNCHDQVRLECLTWPVSFILGATRVRLKTLNLIESGDVLLVQELMCQLFCYEQRVGSFEWSEGEHMMEFKDNEGNIEQDEGGMLIDSEAQLPVKLEYILHRRMLTLKEMKDLSRQGCLPLPEGVENNVSIHINGALVGRGELVQLDNKLGVEIHTWFSVGANDE